MIKFKQEKPWLWTVLRTLDPLEGQSGADTIPGPLHLGMLHVTDGWTADLCCEGFTSDELRAIADKLFELNGHFRRNERRKKDGK